MGTPEPFPRRRPSRTAGQSVLAAASHDLRAPLNSIQTWAHVLEAELRAPSPAARRALDGIRAGIRDQVRLLEALLESAPPTFPPRGARGEGEDR